MVNPAPDEPTRGAPDEPTRGSEYPPIDDSAPPTDPQVPVDYPVDAGTPPQQYPVPPDYPPSGYSQPGHPQSGYSQPDYPQSGYSQPDYQQAGYPQMGYPPAGYPAQYPTGYPYGYDPYAPTKPIGTNGKAIASLATSVIGMLCCVIPSVIGIVLGVLAMQETKRTGQDGHGLALAGVIVGSLAVAFGLFVLLAFFAFDGLHTSSSYSSY